MSEKTEPPEEAQPGPDEGDSSKKRKRTRSTSKKKDDPGATDEQGQKKERATREDKGIPRLEERDLLVLRWIMQMYAIRFDQLQVLLARHSPKKEELADPERVSPSTVRTHLRRWKVLGLITYKKILAGKEDPLWVWISAAGLKYLAYEEDAQGELIVYTFYLPKPRELPHLYLINQARLYIESVYPTYTFRSERQLRQEQHGRPKAIKQKHFTDGTFFRPDGKPIALEVERWDKAAERLEAILLELAQTYHRTWYFVSRQALTAVRKAQAKLPEELGRRIQLLSSEVKLLGQPAKEAEDEITEG